MNFNVIITLHPSSPLRPNSSLCICVKKLFTVPTKPVPTKHVSITILSIPNSKPPATVSSALAKTPKTTQSSVQSNEEDLLHFLNDVKRCKRKIKVKPVKCLRGEYLLHMKQHEWLINKAVDDFLDSLASVPNNKWNSILVLVPFKSLNGRSSRSKF